MPRIEPTVFVVDDDHALCDALQWLLEAARLRVKTYASADAFQTDYQPDRPGCLVLDIRMPGLSGLELQAQLVRKKIALPIIFITGHGDIPMAVQAVKNGAVDFLEKPVRPQLLLDHIRHALALDAQWRAERKWCNAVAARYRSLTERERQVLPLVVDGRANKVIAAELGIAEKTVERHRKGLLSKMEVEGAVGLVSLMAKWKSLTTAGQTRRPGRARSLDADPPSASIASPE